MNKVNIKEENIENINLKTSYFHYTNISNIEGISQNGLLPLKGESSTGIEKTKKVFFTVGSDQFLILLDVWIRWLLAKGLIDLPGKKLDSPTYHFFASIIKYPFIPKFLVNLIVKWELNSNILRVKIFKQFKELMENSVLLKLDLENGVDFDFSDIDEVKSQKYNKDLLKMVYSTNSNVSDNQMEYWNMHTKTDKAISKEKLTLLNYNGHYELKFIVEYLKKNSNLKLKHTCPYLYQYYKWLENNKQ